MEVQMSFRRKSLTEQVTENMRELIEAKQLSRDSDFPSSRTLAQRYGVSHNVMLKALRQLQDEGLIYLNSKRKGYKLK